MASNSATAVSSQQAIKAYVTASIAAEALDPDPMTGNSDSSGSVTFPNGMIIAWGTSNIGDRATVNIAHGLTKCFQAFTGSRDGALTAFYMLNMAAIDDTNITVKNPQPTPLAFNWWAIGR